MNSFIFFLVLIGHNGSHNVVKTNAESCEQAIELTRAHMPTGHTLIADCIGVSDDELETLDRHTNYLKSEQLK